MVDTRRKTYPFSAIIGQREMKLALILNAVDPGVGGVLIRGEKGTAKSTAARALAALLPEIHVVRGCHFSCHPDDPPLLCDDCLRTRELLLRGTEERLPGERLPAKTLPVSKRRVRIVEIPLNATEDMVLGSIDFSRAIKEGERVFQPGLLGRANRGIVYVDEVNLLDDHLVDIILDAAGSGVNIVEREGIHYSHPARFVLVGTMNPEEGEIRPQLLDRFGLCVEVRGLEDREERVEMMNRREEYDRDPDQFIASFRGLDEEEGKRIAEARKLLPGVEVPRQMRTFISELSSRHNVAGHRADLVIQRAAAAYTAYRGALEVTHRDIQQVASMALRHRMRDASQPQPLPERKPKPSEDNREEKDKKEDERKKRQDRGDNREREDRPERGENSEENPLKEVYSVEIPERDGEPDGEIRENMQPREGGEGRDKTFKAGEMFRVRKIEQRKDRKPRLGSGRRSKTRTPQKQGRYVKSTYDRETKDLALDATLRAAAPYQKARLERAGIRSDQSSYSGEGRRFIITKGDLHRKVREKRIGAFFLFIVDASGSMGAKGRMVAAKGAVLSLLMDAYQKRDTVSLVVFRRREAQVLLPPTSSVERAFTILKELPLGGRTPLSDGLIKGERIIRTRLMKEPLGKPIVLIVTDGKSNVSVGGGAPGEESLLIAARMASEQRARFIVVDTESTGMVNFGYAQRLAMALRGDYCKIEDLKARDLVQLVRSM